MSYNKIIFSRITNCWAAPRNPRAGREAKGSAAAPLPTSVQKFSIPFNLAVVHPPRIENASGKTIVIRGWKGTLWNYNYGFTAEVFAKAVAEYLVRKGRDVDSIIISRVIPGMGVTERHNSRTGLSEKCLFIPEKLLEMDPGLNGLNDDYPRFTQVALNDSNFISLARLEELISLVNRCKRLHEGSRIKMEKALKLHYGVEQNCPPATQGEIAKELKVSKQAANQLLAKVEHFLSSFAPSKMALQEMRLVISCLITWLMGEKKSITLKESIKALVDLALVREGEEWVVSPALRLITRLSPGGLRYFGRGPEILTGLPPELSWRKITGEMLFFIHPVTNQPVPFPKGDPLSFRLGTLSSIDAARAEKPSNAESIADLIQQRGPLHFNKVALLLGNPPKTVENILTQNTQFVEVGRGIFALAKNFPGLKNTAFPSHIKRKSWAFAAIRYTLQNHPHPLTPGQIHREMVTGGFRWSRSIIEKVLKEDANYKDCFHGENNRYSLITAP